MLQIYCIIVQRFMITGFVIYKLKNKEDARSQMGENFFKYTAHSALSDNFVNAREVTGRFKLSPGTYIIVPSTYQPDCEGEFLLRAFKEKLRTEKKSKNYSNNVDHHAIENRLDNRELTKKEEKKPKEKKSKEKEKIQIPSSNLIANVIDDKMNAVEKVTKQETNFENAKSNKRDTIHHFKYKDEEDECWACITSPDTTIITITTPGSTVMTITIMDHVKNSS